MNAGWVWIDPRVLLAAHDEQLVEHGGAAGTRDLGLFESAMARPRNLAHDGEPDFAALAASYGCGLARNHPFVDGNKRTAFVAVELFMALNGHELTASDAECVMVMLDVAAGKLEDEGFAEWIPQHSMVVEGP